jgi:transcription antitermination factor NusG
MDDFKVGDRVRILPGIATPFVGMDGTISEVRPHDQGIEAMTKHFVVFSRNEKRFFYRAELVHIPRPEKL